MAEPEPERGDAAAFIRNAPFDVHMSLVRRLSPKWILRIRLVCKAWRDKLCHGALLFPLHGLQPPQPLLCFGLAACPDRYIQSATTASSPSTSAPASCAPSSGSPTTRTTSSTSTTSRAVTLPPSSTTTLSTTKG